VLAANREAELAAVEINQEDVVLIAAEMDVSAESAERTLREAGGVVVDALRNLLQ
jgi:NACalpha-BTF3-like transcription factor